MNLISLSFLILMFSSAARAFSSTAKPALLFRQHAAAARTLRPMSTTGGEPDTSVVDVCLKKIQEALGSDDVKVTGAYDDPNGSHIAIEVVSDKFEGKRMVQRQQMVYKAIWKELEGPVHAVDSMVCKTPSE